MKHKRNWIIGFALFATAVFVAWQTVIAPKQDETIPNIEIPFTETLPAPSGSCYFNWAYHIDPNLTEKLDVAVKDINPDASATVTLFGEDCIYDNGSSTFIVMETDFQVRLLVEDLSAHEDFGNWMRQIMSIVVAIPQKEIQGNYGFVEFWFEKSEMENLIVRIPIQKYIDEAEGKTGVELFNTFYQQ